MKKIIHILLPVVLLWGVITQGVFGYSGEIITEPKTIREMQEDINSLEQEKSLLNFKWETFKIGEGTIADLMRDDLSDKELTGLRLTVEKYYSESQIGEEVLDSSLQESEIWKKQRKELLLKKQEFYTALLPYIKNENIGKLKEYIGVDLEINERSKDVSKEIITTQNEKTRRVEELEQQIQDNNLAVKNSIQIKIQAQIEVKLDQFVNSQNFSQLTNTQKQSVFQKFIDKINSEILSLQNMQEPTSIIEDRIEIFTILMNYLSTYIDEWEE